MQRQQRHEWKEETEEGLRIYKAVYHSKEWRFATSMKARRAAPAEWEDVDKPTVANWEGLRDVLFRKYQRKRCPWKLIEDIDKMLEKGI